MILRKNAFTTVLQGLRSTDPSDFPSDELYLRLLFAEFDKEPVQVDSVEVEVQGGRTNYYNITLMDGQEVQAISGYHLRDIAKYKR